LEFWLKLELRRKHYTIMLGIIFTRKHILAGWVFEGTVKWFQLGAKQQLQHDGNLLATLQLHFHQILEAAQWYAFGNGMTTPLDSPSLALLFPGDASYIAEEEKQSILDWLMSLHVQWASIQLCDTMSLLPKILPYKYPNYLLFEAFDDVAHATSNITNIQTQLLQFNFGSLGKTEGIKKIYNIILSEIKNKNLKLNKQQEDYIIAYLENFDTNKKLIINQLDIFPKISLDLTLSESRYYDLLTYQRNIYLEIINILKIFDFIEISIIFASDLYDNSVFTDYVSHISPSSFFQQGEILFFDEAFCFEKLLIYMSKFHNQQSNRNQKLTKSKLLAEIKTKCTDKRKYREYISKYTALARTIAMPDEVVQWYIRQNLYGLSSLHKLGEVVSNKPYATISVENSKKQESYAWSAPTSQQQLREVQPPKITDSIIPTRLVEMETQFTPTDVTIKPDNKQESSISIAPTLRVLDNATQHDIASFALFEQNFPSTEFIYFKGKLKNERHLKVFRYLKNNKDASAVLAFQRLFEREKSYYSDLSSLLNSADGASYYYRNYIEGESLEKYVRQIGLHKKYRIKELTANDLELMLELWRSIYLLKFDYNTLSKKSFIVSQQWRLSLKKEVEISMIDFDTTDSTKTLMEQQLIEIFEELFGKNLTNEFIIQFQNTV
jgi:hypothetical protein